MSNERRDGQSQNNNRSKDAQSSQKQNTNQPTDQNGQKKNTGNAKGARKNTSSYRHVNLERKRPQLTREGSTAQSKQTNQSKQGNQNKQNSQGKQNRQNKAKTSNKSNKPKQAHFSAAYPTKDPSARLEVIPLGGLDAIGKNMTVFECKGDMILDDAGLMFPDDDHPGVDLILPDYTYVLENADKLRGIVITHGHEDHVGSLPYLIKDLDRPVTIYATKLTLGLIEIKFNEHNIKNAKLVEIKPGQQIKLGCFTIDFFSVNHSIPDAVGLFIQSPAGNILHTGDFKLDQTPIDGVRTDFAALTRFSEVGVDLLLSDSTNAQNTEFTPSEAEVGKVLNEIVAQAKDRVIVAAFASHIHRMQQICDAAVNNGRKVVVTGRSMIQNIDVARQLGYLSIDDDNLIDAYELKDMPNDRIVIMCTGSQGEPLSALARIANGEHKTISIEAGDTVIISATPVPGNEKAVTRVVNSLSKIGADIYDKSRARVHVSGHGGSEELKIMLSMVKPKAFMPVHGEAMHLRAHAKLAQACGIAPENIFILENGDSLVLTSRGINRGESVQSGIVYVDGLSVGDMSQDVLDERVALADEGVASVSIAVSLKRGEVLSEPQIVMRGITGGDDKYLISEAASTVSRSVRRGLAEPNRDIKTVRKTVRDALSSLLWDRTKQRPMVIVSLLDVDHAR